MWGCGGDCCSAPQYGWGRGGGRGGTHTHTHTHTQEHTGTHTRMLHLPFSDLPSRAAKQGCFKRGGFPIWTCPSFFCPFLSFLELSRFFWDFPDLLGDGPGIFPICSFPLSRPIKSTYEEQSRKGPRHNLDLSQKKWETPGFGNPPV